MATKGTEVGQQVAAKNDQKMTTRLYGFMRLNEIDLKSLGPCRVQVQINNALRLKSAFF
jgi:hypothetical protein